MEIITKSEKRKEFEKAKWVRNPVDIMWDNPKADKSCKTCDGHGVVVEEFLLGDIEENCPDCWN